MKEYASLLPLLGVLLLFWLLLIRPAQRRNKALAELQAAVQPGDRIMLSSGIHGTVRSVQNDQAEVEIAPGTVITVARAAIGRVLGPDGSAPDGEG